MITITVDTRKAVVTDKEIITAGSVGMEVQFSFSSDWDGLDKFVIFRNGDVSASKTIAQLSETGIIEIPAENTVQAYVDDVIFAGVYGQNDEDTIVIPTIWASIGPLRDGANYEDPILPEDAQTMREYIESLADEACEEAVEDAQEWATGERGDDTPSTTNNSKYYSQQSRSFSEQSRSFSQDAEASDNSAEEFAQESEAWARGTKDGVAVPDTDDTYHNNSKNYSEQSAASAEQAETAAARDTAAWLNEHITNPDSPPLDRTLLSSSAAAPADMVGDLKNTFQYNFKTSAVNFNISGKYVYLDGSYKNNSDWYTADFILVKGDCLYIKGIFSSLSGVGYNIALYDENKSFINEGYVLGAEGAGGVYFDVSDATYIRISNINTQGAEIGFLEGWENKIFFERLSNDLSLSFSNPGYLQTNGTVKTSATDWRTTPYISVSAIGVFFQGKWQNLAGAGYNICLYDTNKQFLRGYACGSDIECFDTSDAAYIRLSSHTPYLNITGKAVYQLNNENCKKPECIVDINGGGYYTSLLQALKSTTADTPIRLKSGTYDLITEYENYYGSDFFTNYAGYAGVADPFYRGLWLDQGRKIIGDAGATIKCVYTGNNNNVARLFSAIANAGNTLLENVTIEHGNLRYAIHDDFGATNSKIEWRNIRFVGNSNGSVIGGGLGLNTTIIIDGCVFEGSRQPWDINYHGSNSAETTNINKIYVTNCKGNHGFGIWPNGSATTLSTAFVSNSKFSEITCYRPDGQDQSQIMNVELIEWNNTVDS